MTKALLCLPSVSYSVVKDRGVVACPMEPGRVTHTARPLPEEGSGGQRSMEAAAASTATDPLSNLVEIAGLEPAASGLQSRRSPS
jgi:hypothetical protein